MSIVYSLILAWQLTPALAAKSCHEFVGYGRLSVDNKKVSLVTHENSQEEKVWSIQTKDFKNNLEIQASVNVFVRVEGLLKDHVLILGKVERSAEAFKNARGARAVQLSLSKDCSSTF